MLQRPSLRRSPDSRVLILPLSCQPKAQGLGLAANQQTSTGSTGLGIGTGTGSVSGTGTGTGSGSGNGLTNGALQSSLSDPLTPGGPTPLPTGGMLRIQGVFVSVINP